jgi:hypothetical protein
MALLGIYLHPQHALKGTDAYSATDCRSSRFSLCSNSSLESTVETPTESNCDCHTEPIVRTQLSRCHLSGHTKNQFVEGRLSNVIISIQREPDKRISITADATYHGQNTGVRGTRLIDTRWKYRHVEIARALLKEFVHELYLELTTKPSIKRSWRDELVQEFPCEEVLDLKDDVIGASVQNIQWARGFRWGGDANYDPQIDGDVLLRAGCMLNDHKPAPPVWEPRSSVSSTTSFDDLEAVRESITARSGSISIGAVRDKRSVDAYGHPWCVARFECSCVIVKLPIVA